MRESPPMTSFTYSIFLATVSAWGIKALGQIVGAAENATGIASAFLYNLVTGKVFNLGGFGGSTSTAAAINVLGQVVGGAFTSLDVSSRGFIVEFPWKSLQALGTFGGKNSNALGLNNLGGVVGAADAAGGEHAFIYVNGKMQDLNDDKLPTGWLLSEADDINDAGAIVGCGIVAGQLHAYLLH